VNKPGNNWVWVYPTHTLPMAIPIEVFVVDRELGERDKDPQLQARSY